jgi:hypothetical protein
MQAIITKFINPTNHRGARIKAIAAAGSVTVPYEYGSDTTGAHRVAAVAFCDKFDWEFDHVSGELPDGSLAWVKNTRKSLSQRVQAIAQGDTYDAHDLKRALSWCDTYEERQTIEACLRGEQTLENRFRLQEIAIRIGV